MADASQDLGFVPRASVWSPPRVLSLPAAGAEPAAAAVFAGIGWRRKVVSSSSSPAANRLAGIQTSNLIVTSCYFQTLTSSAVEPPPSVTDGADDSRHKLRPQTSPPPSKMTKQCVEGATRTCRNIPEMWAWPWP